MITMDKKYRYRNGEPARVLCVDSGDKNFPVVSIDQMGEPSVHTATGRYYIDNEDSSNDLIEIRPKVRVSFWVNIYPTKNISAGWGSKEEADNSAGSNRIACIHIEREVEEGEGL